MAKWSGAGKRAQNPESTERKPRVRQASRDVVMRAWTKGVSSVPSWLGYLPGRGQVSNRERTVLARGPAHCPGSFFPGVVGERNSWLLSKATGSFNLALRSGEKGSMSVCFTPHPGARCAQREISVARSHGRPEGAKSRMCMSHSEFKTFYGNKRAAGKVPSAPGRSRQFGLSK